MRRVLQPVLGVLLVFVVLFATAGCGEPDPKEEGAPGDIASIQQALSSIDCTESTATGYDDGKAFTITLVTVDGKKAEKATANAYYVMAKAAAAAGVNLQVISGFRTMAEQTYLYNCYINCNCNSCNLAAKPGYSNHQSGHALDLNTSAPGVYTWLSNHAAYFGFKRTVPSEAWHWEWWGGGPGGGPCVDAPKFPLLSIDVDAATLNGQERDICQRSGSNGIFDLWKGQTAQMTVDVKNAGNLAAANVKVAIWVQEPYLTVTRWTILTNWKSSGFVINDTDGQQKVGRENPGQSFTLWLAAISPGETKRVSLKVQATRFSFGIVEHPDLRAWVAHVDDFYDKSDWSSAPKNVGSHQKQNGGDLKSFFQSDVLDKESCDQKDNDCDGDIDEDEVCTQPAPADPSQPLPDETGNDPADPAPSGDPGAAPGAPAGGSCALASTPDAAPSRSPLLLVLGAFLALRYRRKRWRSH